MRLEAVSEVVVDGPGALHLLLCCMQIYGAQSDLVEI